MKVTKVEKKIQKKITKDIQEIKNIYDLGGVEKTLKQINNYYNMSRYSEETLLFRMNRLDSKKLLFDTIFSFPIGFALGFGLETIPERLFVFSSINEYFSNIGQSLIIFTLVMIFVVVYVKNDSTAEGGRDNYIDKKEIEIITSVIERRSKRKYRRFRRTY